MFLSLSRKVGGVLFVKRNADVIAKKIKRATTDPEMLPTEAKGLEGRAEAENLVAIYAALAAFRNAFTV